MKGPLMAGPRYVVARDPYYTRGGTRHYLTASGDPSVGDVVEEAPSFPGIDDEGDRFVYFGETGTAYAIAADVLIPVETATKARGLDSLEEFVHLLVAGHGVTLDKPLIRPNVLASLFVEWGTPADKIEAAVAVAVIRSLED